MRRGTTLKTPTLTRLTPTPIPSLAGGPLRHAEPGSRGLKVGPFEYAYIVNKIWPTRNPVLNTDSYHLDVYDFVRATGLPNYLGTRIRIPSDIIATRGTTSCMVTMMLRLQTICVLVGRAAIRPQVPPHRPSETTRALSIFRRRFLLSLRRRVGLAPYLARLAAPLSLPGPKSAP